MTHWDTFPDTDLLPTPTSHAALSAEVARLRQQIATYRDSLQWTAQMIHQAYHQEQKGSWRECPMSVCEHIAKVTEAMGIVRG